MVYGASLDAFCSVQALLSRGVAPSRIIAVQPPASSDAPDALADPRVLAKVMAKLGGLGVRVEANTRLAGLESDEAQQLRDPNPNPSPLLLTPTPAPART